MLDLCWREVFGDAGVIGDNLAEVSIGGIPDSHCIGFYATDGLRKPPLEPDWVIPA